MKITLPQQAQDRFNTEAEKLLLMPKPSARKEEPNLAHLSNAHRLVEHTITEQEMKSVAAFGSIDGFGQAKAKYFQTEVAVPIEPMFRKEV